MGREGSGERDVELMSDPGAVLHLDKLHAKHLLPGFKDRTLEEREIEAVATDITRVRPPLSALPTPR